MNTTKTPDIDMAQAEAFAGRVMGLMDAGAAAVMISIGHRLGLFDRLAEFNGGATSIELSEATGCFERYVREWLAVMVVADVVEYESVARRYRLPPEHSACLTRDTSLGNLAVYAQHVALMGKLEDRMVRNFKTGEGTSYGEYPCFHQIMAEDSSQTVTAALFDHILPLAPGLHERLEDGIDVLDAGCGKGSALMALARRYPQSRFTGYDLCIDAIEDAQAAASSMCLSNLRFVARDLTGYVEPDRWDLITSFDAVHDQKDPSGLVKGIHASLRHGGIYLMQDIGASADLENNHNFPCATLLYAISTMHCTPVSIGQGGQGLGTMWGWETAERFLREAGFTSVERHVLAHDSMNVWFVSRVSP